MKTQPELDLPRVRPSVASFALPPLQFFAHHGHACAIHLHIHHRDRLAHRDGQLSLQGLLDGVLLAVGDIRADALRGPFDRLGGDFQPGQQLHLLAAALERGALTTHQSQHAAHPGRELGVFHIQRRVGGELPLLTAGAPVISAPHFRATQHGKQRLGAHPLIAGLTSAGARYLRFRRGLLSEKLAQTSGTGLLQGGAQGHLHRFQVHCARLVTCGENHSQQRIYFPRDLLMDRSSRFFSCAVQSPCPCGSGKRYKRCCRAIV